MLPFTRLVQSSVAVTAMVVSVLSAHAQSTELPLADMRPTPDRCADLAEQRDRGTLPLRREPSVTMSTPSMFETVATAPLRSRVRARKPAEVSFDPRAHTGRIVLKLADDEGFSVGNDGVLTAANPGRSEDLGAVVNHSLGAVDIKRIFTRPERHLAFDRFCGERWMGEEMPDLTQYLILSPQAIKDVARIESVVRDLNALPFVEVAYFEGQTPLPVSPSGARAKHGTYENLQGYLAAAPAGIDALFAWTRPGGTGLNVRMIDVELGWNVWRVEPSGNINLGHEDLPLPFAKLGTPATASNLTWHGTAVLGIIGAKHNDIGVTGIVHDAVIGLSATGESNATFANAINVASGILVNGEVILVELQVEGPQNLNPAMPCGQVSASGRPYVPAEFDIAVYSAITTATGNQRIVIEAAGNGAISLADPLFGGMFDPSHPYFQESNAIMVGARQSGSGAPKCETNHGARLDASAWGENVATAGGASPWRNLTPPPPPPGSWPDDSNDLYTSQFGGTSSAAAIIAGAVVSIQSIQLGRLGRPFPPNAMRKLLRMFGTPQRADPRLIGSMPDLRAVYQWIIADSDGDGMANGDELAIGRNPSLSEPATLAILLNTLEE